MRIIYGVEKHQGDRYKEWLKAIEHRGWSPQNEKKLKTRRRGRGQVLQAVGPVAVVAC